MNRSAVLFVALVLLVTLTPPAHAQPLQVRLVSLSWLVRSGDDATIAVQTDPGAVCLITVRDNSGPSDARTLRPKTADARGIVSWTWQVEAGTIGGRWPRDSLLRLTKELIVRGLESLSVASSRGQA